MIVRLLTEHHLEFLSLKGGCRDSSESTLVKMSNCWKFHAATHTSFYLRHKILQSFQMGSCMVPGYLNRLRRPRRRCWRSDRNHLYNPLKKIKRHCLKRSIADSYVYIMHKLINRPPDKSAVLKIVLMISCAVCSQILLFALLKHTL